MKESYLTSYIDVEGKLNVRKPFNKVMTFLFAGTKFFFDRLLALIGLIILCPLMLIIAIAIKIDSKGPALFKQERTGKRGKTFTLYKFRSMCKENNYKDFSKPDQYTKVGKILRKTSLDELPQLINILKGDMSFIGPRPWVVECYKYMDKKQKHRNDVRPGITGLAQVNGRQCINILERIKYDLVYIEHYSLWMDIKIVFLTIKTVFTADGADAGKKEKIQDEIMTLKNQHRRKKKDMK